jgi:apolipoprotein N-acyltransferase
MGVLGSAGFAQHNITLAFLLSFAYLFAEIICCKDEGWNSSWAAFWFSLFFYASNLYWLAFPLTIDFKTHGALIPVALMLIPSFLSLQIVIATLVTQKFFSTVYQRMLFFPAAVSTMMYIFGHFPINFPWILPGYAWCCHEVFLQTLSIYGIYGLSIVTMLMATLLGASYVFYHSRKIKNAIITLLVSLLLLLKMIGYGFVHLHDHKTIYTGLKARIVQCNLSQEEKNDESLDQKNLLQYLYRSNISNTIEKSGKIDFTVWPEASIPHLYRDDMAGLNDLLRSVLSTGSHLIAGAVREDIATGKIYNSAIVMGDDDNILKYDKIHLVPFGEYIPFRRCIPAQFLSSIASSVGDFDVGDAPKILRLNGLNVVLCICFECVFPLEFIPKNAKGYPDLDSVDLLVNLTNDAWFGPTSEPFQHLQICRSRAIECGVPLIRATNFGISAVFDGCGVELARIDMNTAGTIDVNIPKKNFGSTLYGRYGDVIFCIMVLLLLIMAGMGKYMMRIEKR